MIKNKITLNVLADITKKIGGVNYTQDENKVLLIFNGSNIDLKKHIEGLKKIQEKGVGFSLAFSFMGERLLDVDYIIKELRPLKVYKEEDIFNIEEIVNTYSYVIGTNVTMNTLTKVISGMIDTFIPNIIWAFLYKGKPVYLNFSSVRNYLGGPSNNKVIKDMIEDKIENIKRMGVTEINIEDYSKEFFNYDSRGKDDIPQGEVKEESNNKIRIITERDLLNYKSKEPLIIRKGTIITPLAKDRAKELGITLEFKM